MTRDEIFGALKENMRAIISAAKSAEILETKSLVNDFGADSLEIVEVVSRTMKQLRLKVPRTELADALTIGDLVSLFEQAAIRKDRPLT